MAAIPAEITAFLFFNFQSSQASTSILARKTEAAKPAEKTVLATPVSIAASPASIVATPISHAATPAAIVATPAAAAAIQSGTASALLQSISASEALEKELENVREKHVSIL